MRYPTNKDQARRLRCIEVAAAIMGPAPVYKAGRYQSERERDDKERVGLCLRYAKSLHDFVTESDDDAS